MKKTKQIKDQPLLVTALGGLGQIGMNAMLLVWKQEAMLIDCGVQFPDQNQPGIDLILPALAPALKKDINLRGIVVTHAHEDHIGAIPFLLRQRKVPVYCSEYAENLIAKKLGEHELPKPHGFKRIKSRDRIVLGPFEIELIPVSHSTVECFALAIDTPLGKVIHTGDFKIDPSPEYPEIATDMKRFAELGEEGVYALLSDSTNVEVPGSSKVESEVETGIEELLLETQGCFVVSSFSSNIPRIQQVFRIAHRNKRKVLLLGRSLQFNVEVATSIGKLKVPKGLLVDEFEACRLPREKLVMVCTGSQGEPRSALSKIAGGAFKNIFLEQGDQVVLSSRFIPGNEKSIYDVINRLHRQGARVHTAKGSDVHVSGHAYKEDLREMILAVRPKVFLPIHGEYRHLTLHQELARECGVEKCLLAENGEEIRMWPDRVEILEAEAHQPFYVLEKDMSASADDLLRDRRKLAYCGVIAICASLSKKKGELLGLPLIRSRGVFFDDQQELRDKELADYVAKRYHKDLPRSDGNSALLLIHAARKFVAERWGRKPLVIPFIVQS